MSILGEDFLREVETIWIDQDRFTLLCGFSEEDSGYLLNPLHFKSVKSHKKTHREIRKKSEFGHGWRQQNNKGIS